MPLGKLFVVSLPYCHIKARATDETKVISSNSNIGR